MSKRSLLFFKNSELAELARRTPENRDRYVDFLRAFSISAVVIGHWLSAVLIRSGGGLRVVNAAGMIPGMWILTWVFQVMPLFFFVGGFSNLVTLETFKRRGESLVTFYRTRAIRLLTPTGIFLGIWFMILVVPSFFFVGWRRFAVSTYMMFGPLWFLGVYLMVIMVSPVMRVLHRRFGILIPAFLGLGAIVVDVVSFGLKILGLRWANVGLVWLFAHQLGFFYADGSLVRKPKWLYALMVLGGLGSLIVLTNIGVYPKSMVGTGFERFSNMNPPTVCILALTFLQVGVGLLLRNPLTRWLSRPKPWMTVIAANTVIMTVYLWHLSAYSLTYLLLYPLGFGHQTTSTLFFWLERPVWIVAPAILLVILLGIFARFERPGWIKRIRMGSSHIQRGKI